MDGAQEPAQFLLIVQELKASVGFTGGRDINQGQQDPGQYLDREAKEGHTPENVEPAGAAFRDWMAAGRLPDFDEVEPPLEPHRHVNQRADDRSFLSTYSFYVGLAKVGRTPALICSSPFSTLCSYT